MDVTIPPCTVCCFEHFFKFCSVDHWLEVSVWDKLRWNTNDPLPTFYLSLPLYKIMVVKWNEVKAFGRNASNNIVVVFLRPVSVCFLLAISVSYCSLRDIPFFFSSFVCLCDLFKPQTVSRVRHSLSNKWAGAGIKGFYYWWKTFLPYCRHE